jgi:hypothetical protein
MRRMRIRRRTRRRRRRRRRRRGRKEEALTKTSWRKTESWPGPPPCVV